MFNIHSIEFIWFDVTGEKRSSSYAQIYMHKALVLVGTRIQRGERE